MKLFILNKNHATENLTDYLEAQMVTKWLHSPSFPPKKGSSKNAETLAGSVPGAGIEPAQPLGPRDFKSLASTNSATQA